MALHFELAEFADRRRRLARAMAEEGLDALLAFKPETHYWLSGYDTFGFCFFQCLLVTADGRQVLLTRSADLRQAALTSTIDDRRSWIDREGARPALDLVDLLVEFGLAKGRLGVEWNTHGLTAAAGMALAEALPAATTTVDASLLVSRLRLVKSAAELRYVRRAANLADDAFDAALAVIEPGGDEAAVHAEMHRVIHAGDGDDPANPFIVNSGDHALLCRYTTGRRRFDARDQLTLEWAGTFRHYHAAQMRTVPIGGASDRHLELFDAATEALVACEARLRPGHTVGDVFAAHQTVLDGRGLGEHRLNACGYALGAVYAPSWMDWPMMYAGNPVELAADMVFFLHMILMDSATGTAMCLGRTSRVTDGSPEVLSRNPMALVSR
ncbi:MAG: Xaa-Pro peptidase family protein [Pseudomonadota bacterium]